jgi:hypothetical protein
MRRRANALILAGIENWFAGCRARAGPSARVSVPPMPARASSLPPDFSWLRSTYRPSDQEVDTFAHLIAHREGYPSADGNSRLFDEAELQLWAGRTEERKRSSKPRGAARGKSNAVAA